ncbi:hypothetical protein A1O3_03716 [Capronia epimyces CBS 606.96]|uniref:Xylose isomerase-like TIM barrel domain-containing protein n=1 Tax=Capronia epimyces CBS 606.96 TaxID=1182542 RepID=W9Y1S2_9EURO|nr:uncharacterized protein A1O3_03716 [Capronia epimyces CBS 606.96]EXJ86762.1 hypothetical protein A1O3_03716 [Capronia epimyces CBS 606.96]
MVLKPAVASMSLGRAWLHKLPNKLDQAASQHFQGVEIFYEDLEYFARELASSSSGTSADPTASATQSSSVSPPPSPSQLLEAATTIRQLCQDRSLTIIGMQPFLHYEGLIDRQEHASRIEKLKLWFRIAHSLGTDVIQIPSNFLQDGITGDRDVLVQDLVEVADMGLQERPVIRFAYENLCWGTHVDTWEKAWDLVRQVDRPNFGICLDTFNIAGSVWADPAAVTGKTADADTALAATLAKLRKDIDVTKVFYVQVVDAERMRTPLVQGHAFYAPDQPARMSWSRNARLFAFEEGGYLPVLEITRTILQDLRYQGWVSMELFSQSMADPDPLVPETHARRAAEAWEKLGREIATWGVE